MALGMVICPLVVKAESMAAPYFLMNVIRVSAACQMEAMGWGACSTEDAEHRASQHGRDDKPRWVLRSARLSRDESCAAPTGLWSFFAYPALKRWANLCRAYGARFLH